MKRILFVLTNINILGNTGVKTGFHLPETAHPYSILKDDFIIEFASVNGGPTPAIGLKGLDKDLVSKEFYENHKELYENTKKLNSLNYSDFDAIFFSGGHGTMWDFPQNSDISNAIVKIYEKGGVVASICHGPCALVDVKLSSGEYLVKDKKLTSFSNAEEEAISHTNDVPFLLETALINNGGKYEKATLWQEKVVVDSNIVTGQNPASAFKLGKKIKELLKSN